MRTIFTNVDTTVSPECVAAKKAYTDHCDKMSKEKDAHCEKLAAYKKLNPKCNANCLANHLSELKGFYDNNEVQKKIKKDKSSSIEQKALAQKEIELNNKGIREYLASVNEDVPKKKAEEISVALKGLAKREITRRVLRDKKSNLSQIIVNLRPKCEKASTVDTDPPCKKKAHSERLNASVKTNNIRL